MPPLPTLIAGLIVLLLCARFGASTRCKKTLKLPYIADATHGVCPSCGVSHPRKEVFIEDPELFWRAFRCSSCGFDVVPYLA